MAGPQRILICDDQPMIHETLGVYLKNEGFEYALPWMGRKLQIWRKATSRT